MADIFTKWDANELLKYKSVLFMGDSNFRALYKDFLQLITSNTLIHKENLRNKLQQFQGDTVVHSEPSKARDFTEERTWKNEKHFFHFVFLTRCYGDRVEKVFERIPSEIRPDVVIINSCVWDVTRWGPDGIDEYKKNLHTLIRRFKELLPPSTIVIWGTTLPIDQRMNPTGFLIPQVDFLKYQLRYEVMEANYYAWQLFTENGFDVIDFHYHLQMQIMRRTTDGIHWNPDAMRHMTNLVLTHIALAWEFPLPGRVTGTAIYRKLNGPLFPDIDAPPLPQISQEDFPSKDEWAASPATSKDRKLLASSLKFKFKSNLPSHSSSNQTKENSTWKSKNGKRRLILKAKYGCKTRANRQQDALHDEIDGDHTPTHSPQ